MRALKNLLRLLIAIIVILGCGLVWYGVSIQPQISGVLNAKGLSAPVEIVRDKAGVPHITGQTLSDTLFALGFAHAQDRLWQMEMHRRVANGRLAEILGEPGIGPDRFLRTLGIRRAAEAIARQLDPESRSSYEAYAKGVNAYLAQRTSPLPPEFILTRAPAPEPWTIEDSIGWTIMMAWDLGGNWNGELTRLRLVQQGWSTEKIKQFLPLYKNRPYPEGPDYTAFYKDYLAPKSAQFSALDLPPREEPGLGSNNWVISGSRTQSGKPLLANDPHLGLSAPALWYFAHLSAPGINVIGASLPGVPGIVLGRNDRVAWGFTNTGPDVQDLFIEKIDPANPANYITPEGSKPFDIVTERIRVKGGQDIELKIRVTRHGPVISDGASASASGLLKDGYAIAFQWTALNPANTTARAFMGLNTAKNWDDFKAGTRLFQAPQQNIVYADVDGNIGYVSPGQVPVRKAENKLGGLVPGLGWDATYDWNGFLAFEDLPQDFNPARGYKHTANEDITEPGYPHFITYNWSASYRGDRIKERIEAVSKHDLNSMRLIQADIVSRLALEYLPILTATPGTTDEEKRLITLLKGFNGDMRIDRTEPLILNVWIRELTRLVYQDETGDMFDNFWDQRPELMMNVLNNINGSGQICDDITTPEKETCGDMIARSLTLAVVDLKKRYGEDPAKWLWGTAHYARSAHRPFSRVPALARFFDVTVPVPGDTFTVNVNRHHIDNEKEPFASNHAASLRGIYDMSDPEKSLFIHSTGQSGIVFSPLYRNLSQRWADVDYLPMQMKRESYSQDAMGTLLLQP